MRRELFFQDLFFTALFQVDVDEETPGAGSVDRPASETANLSREKKP